MKYGLKRRILSLVLCVCMIFPMISHAMPVFSVASTDFEEAFQQDFNENIGKQAIFDWAFDFMLVDDPGREDIADIYWDTDTDQPHTDGKNYWYLYEENFNELGTPTGEPYIGANGLVMKIVGYYYDSVNGWHWYKVAGDNLPNMLVEKPWVLYCTDSDIEEGYDPYLCIYDENEVIRFVSSVEDSYYNYYVVAGPSELQYAEISISRGNSDCPISDLAYTEPTYGTTFKKSYDITITKKNGESWTESDGVISIRYEAAQLGVDTYIENVNCGAAFAYINNRMFSAASTDRWGYEISDLVYINSGISTIVFEHMLSSFEPVNKVGYFVNDTVEMYSNTFASKDFAVTQLPEQFFVSYIFTYEDVEYFWIESKSFIGSSYFIAKAEDVVLEQTLVDYSGEVTVSGKMPAGVYLDATKVSLDALANAYPNPTPEYDYNIADSVPHVIYDLSLIRGEDKWQPLDGDKVTVTIDSEDLQLTPGDVYLVYHLHIDENGKPIPEWLGLFNSEKGEATFVMDKFSYVLVLNPGTTTISNNVKAFYPVSSYAADPSTLPPAGNGQWFIVGIYFETDNTAHILLGSNGKMPALNKIEYVGVDGQTFYNPAAKGYRPSADKKEATFTPYDKSVTKIDMQISDSNTVTVIDLAKVTNATSFGAVLDIRLDNTIQIGNEFELSLKATTGGSSTDNSFNIGGLDVSLYLEYNIQKEVAVGTSANGNFAESVTVERGDWVIYRIAINNTGTLPLEGMHLEDLLPVGVFDMSSVQMSVDGINGQEGTWQPFTPDHPYLFENYSSEGKFTHYVYLKAQVLTNLNINQDTKYTNIATFDGMGMPIIEDTADILVKAPQKGTLTVSKAVTTANPNDPAPVNAAYTFTLNVTGTTQNAFTYTLNGVSYTISNGGTFQLKNGESAVFKDFPVDAVYTVTETVNSQYTTKVNGQNGYSFSGTMEENGSPVVAFENQFKVREGAITVNKVVNKEYEYDTLPNDEYTFTIEFDVNYRDKSYDYEIDGVVKGQISHGGSITIKSGQSFVIVGYPNKTSYTIKEITDDKYTTTVNGENTNVVNGISSISGTSHTFTNTYKKVLTSLTINKVVNNVESTPIPAGQKFTFEIRHPDGKVTTEIITIQEEIPGGTEQSPGQRYGSITLHGLSVGTYSIKEIDIQPGFDCLWPNDTTNIELTTSGGEVTCTNRYPVYVVHYEAEVGGSVSVDEAGLDITTGKFDPSTATPNNGYEFEGWYDENDNLVSTEKEFAPDIKYDGQTLTAKFKSSLTTLTIKKQGHNPIDENQTFIFTIKGVQGTNTAEIDLTVTIHGNGEITITNLPVGNYVVVEQTEWSWRYEPSEESKNISLSSDVDNSVDFDNTRAEIYWLDGDYYAVNIFKKKED